MPSVEVRVLGPLDVRRNGERVPLGQARLRDLVAVLVASGERYVSADAIVDALWQGEPPPSARKVVQKHVSALRSLIGAERVHTQAGSYLLRDVSVDAVAFARAVERAASEDSAAGAATLGGALAMWTGDAYADVALASLAPERARLLELRLSATHQWNEARLALGQHARLIAPLEQLTAQHPLDEGLWSQLIRALYGAGRQGDALRAYQRLRTVLADQLGIDPTGELQLLERRILAHDPDLVVTPHARPTVAGEPASPVTGRPDEHRRIVTVVAAELDLSSLVDPEDRARRQRDLQGRVGRLCERHGGWVESTLGARVLALFGLPTQEDDAARATLTARQIVTEVTGSRIGIATGWAVLQPSAPPGSRIVGSVVEEAAARASDAAWGEVIIDQSTAQATQSAGPEPPFVGRQAELAVLSQLLARSADGQGPQVVTIIGEPGIGKTRLVDELRQRAPTGVHWLSTRCAGRDDRGPLSPLGAIVRAQSGGYDSSGGAWSSEALEQALGEIVPDDAERKWLVTRVGPAAGVGTETPAERSEVVAAWAAYLGAVARAAPTVIVFDDLHRAHESFDGFLADALVPLRDIPLFVLTTLRPDHQDRRRTAGGGDASTLTLRGLSDGETEALLAHALGDESLSEAERQDVQARSRGNPLYAIEFARMVRQRHWDGSVPSAVRAIISARLDLLPPRERALLNAASVAGPGATIDQLAAMADLDRAHAMDAARQLGRKDLFAAPPPGVVFSHDLVQEVAREQQSRATRFRLNVSAANWLEQTHADWLVDHAIRIAGHLGEAAVALEEDGDDAAELRARHLTFIVMAADRLGGIDADGGAARYDQLGHADLPPSDRSDLLRRRAGILLRAGRLAEATEAVDEALAVAHDAADPIAAARARVLDGTVRWMTGDTAGCIAAMESALAVLDGRAPDPDAVQALGVLAFVTAMQGEPDKAQSTAERGLAIARANNFPEQEIRCLFARGSARIQRGDMHGYYDFTAALETAVANGLSHEASLAYLDLAELHWQGEGPAESLALSRHALDLAERRGVSLAADWLRWNRAQVGFDAGQWTDALAVAREVLAHEAQLGPGQAGTACAVWSARIHVWRGEIAEAEALLQQFLPRARRHAVIQQVGPALIVAGLVAAALGRVDEAAGFVPPKLRP